jgi:hypothetical protein
MAKEKMHDICTILTVNASTASLVIFYSWEVCCIRVQALDERVKKMQSTTVTTTQSSSVPPVKEVTAMNGDAMPQQVLVDEKKESPSAEGYIPHDPAMHAQLPPLMNGMPPSQVYVNTAMGYHGMVGIETQFHSLGMSDAHDSSNHEDSEGNDGTGEGSNEDDTFKLFIGQVRNKDSGSHKLAAARVNYFPFSSGHLLTTDIEQIFSYTLTSLWFCHFLLAGPKTNE